MANLIYLDTALTDFARLTEFLLEAHPTEAAETTRLIEEAINVLADHPLIGRPAPAGLRELVISRGRTGYVALYHFDEISDAVLVLAIRHQRETGYSDPQGREQ